MFLTKCLFYFGFLTKNFWFYGWSFDQNLYFILDFLTKFGQILTSFFPTHLTEHPNFGGEFWWIYHLSLNKSFLMFTLHIFGGPPYRVFLTIHNFHEVPGSISKPVIWCRVSSVDIYFSRFPYFSGLMRSILYFTRKTAKKWGEKNLVQ